MAVAQRRGRRTARLALLGYLLVPVVLTLSADAPSTAFQAFTRVLQGTVDAVTVGEVTVSAREAESLANLLMFIPIGLLLRLSLPSWRLTALLAVSAAGSLAIELVQYLLLPGRTPTLVDVVSNSGGAAIGLVLAADLRRSR